MLNSKWLTIKQFVEANPNFPEAMIRNWIYKNTDDFRTCTRKVGRKIFINVDLFEEWIDKKIF